MEMPPTLTNGRGNKDNAEEGHGGIFVETRKFGANQTVSSILYLESRSFDRYFEEMSLVRGCINR